MKYLSYTPFITKLKNYLKNYKIFINLNRQQNMILNILREPLNKGYRCRLLFKFLSWYCYHKPKNNACQITLQNGFKSIVYADSNSGVSNIFTRNVDYYENKFIRNVLEEGDFIVDAGCNVGNRTLVLADIIGGALLIDANPLCLDRLIKNFNMNGIKMGNYYLWAKAVGSEIKHVNFSDIGGTSCLNKIVSGDDQSLLKANSRTKSVEMTTIDKKMETIGDPPCSFIKLDLEGNDLEGLIGAKKTLLKGNTRLVKFERWSNVSLKLFEHFFDSIDWAIFTLDSNGNPTNSKQIILSSSNLFAKPKHM